MKPTAPEHSQPELGVNQAVGRIHDRLARYLEAQYHIRDSGLIKERRALLAEKGGVSQKPYIEVTPSYAVHSGYADLSLPEPARDLLTALMAMGDVGVFPPYVHQAQALERLWANGGSDLVVATGTGSGKTETFLYALLGMLAVEADSRPSSFRMPAIRALLLYPMNALVSDQTARLRRVLGHEALAGHFREKWGRHPLFGMYTSRTPYPGLRTGSRDQRHIAPILADYVDKECSEDPDVQKLVSELKRRGRWPAKDLVGFFGAERSQRRTYQGGKRGGQEYTRHNWQQRLHTQASDRELLTRHEMQQRAPDLFVTNYSMLEYTLLRPLERSIFGQTKEWLDSDPRNQLTLILDEAHMYRGVGGAEVGLLIRRLQSRLGIGRDRLRCILTSASLRAVDGSADLVQAFARGLCGTHDDRPFALVTGTRETRSGARPGTPAEADILSQIDSVALGAASADLAAAAVVISQVARDLGWRAPPAEAQELELRQYVCVQLSGLGPLELLIEHCSREGTAFFELAQLLFPGVPKDVAERATDGLLALGCFARRTEPGREQQTLVPTRVHMMYRGLPPQYVCINPRCAGRRDPGSSASLVGRMFVEPLPECVDCNSRLYELLTHRDCGTAFLRVFGRSASADFYWHERGGTLSAFGPLHEIHLLLEEPHPEQRDEVDPIWVELQTGRVVTRRPSQPEQYLFCYRPRGNQAAGLSTFARCPKCTRLTRPGGPKTPLKIMDLSTKGEQPFANLIREQFVSQVLTRPKSESHPNGGRKALLFSDGRQKAARLARDLPREVERDSFREALIGAVAQLTAASRDPLLDDTLYKAFVAVCAQHFLHFFDGADQKRLLADINHYRHDYFSDLAMALVEWKPRPPTKYRQALLRQLSDPYYSVQAACAAVVELRAHKLRLLERRLPAIPAAVRVEVATAFVDELLGHAAFDPDLGIEARYDVDPYYEGITIESGLQRFFRRVAARAGLAPDAVADLRRHLFDVLTVEAPGGSRLLNPEGLQLRLALDEVWLQCTACNNVQLSPFLGACANCDEKALEQLAPTHDYMVARKNYFRTPLRGVLRGESPVHITAEEHTAQLSQRDAGVVYATTEEFELRFQDISLGEDKPPVDILSCTTTMEVGIDIGALTAVGLRTMPPQRENYQQRAGRAGRRGTSVSTVLTFAQGGAHDAHYFADPSAIISGPPREPRIKTDNRRLARRHIHSFLFQTFFHEQLDELSREEEHALIATRPSIMSAFGPAVDFFSGGGDFSLGVFERWLEKHVLSSDGSLAGVIAAWLPRELADAPRAATNELEAFARETTRNLVAQLRAIQTDFPVTVLQPEQDPPADDDDSEPDEDLGTLLDLLFDRGILPSYAFPTDLCSFVIQEFHRNGVRVKERPQLAKAQALSEYAPGRLLVVNKETFRVGGIFVGGLPTANPAKALFAAPLSRYVGCGRCNYVRIETGEQITQNESPCPVCDSPVHVRDLLDPPGFSPEAARSLAEGDREQEITFASSAQLPELVDREQFRWREDVGTRLRHAFGVDVALVVANKGRESDLDGFIVCESCGASWLMGHGPEAPGGHKRPFLLPRAVSIKEHVSQLCNGQLRDHLFLGYQFRTDILLLRIPVLPPMGFEPGKPWLGDALSTLAEAVALAASLHMDIDPGELSAGFRFTKEREGQHECAEVYLFDTASGGAGYAADAGRDLIAVLARTRNLLESCPSPDCVTSCTKCLRHYGNRFLHPRLDRRLALQMLDYALSGAAPGIASRDAQVVALRPLENWLRREGWNVDVTREDAPLLAERGADRYAIGLYPALLEESAARALYPTSTAVAGAKVVLLPDYLITHDLPGAYQSVVASNDVSRSATRREYRVWRWGDPGPSDATVRLTGAGEIDGFAMKVTISELRSLGIEPRQWLILRQRDDVSEAVRVLMRRRSGSFVATSSPWTVGYVRRITDQRGDRAQISYGRPEREFRPERLAWETLEIVAEVVDIATGDG